MRTISLILVMFLWNGVASADITEDQAVKCILGEARGEGYESLLAHSEAIRARGHLKGVYGCKADYSREMTYLRSKGILAQAHRAWRESRTSKTVKGATYWGSTIVDKAWIAKMESHGYIRTATIKNTAFYYNPKEGKK